jgi:hypothetical protein
MEDNTWRYLTDNIKQHNRLRMTLIEVGSNSLYPKYLINPLNAELNPICYLLALLGAHHFLHVSRIRVNMNRWF